MDYFTWLEGGIASLAAAAFLIRDGDIPGERITILEESDKIGGSLDASGTPQGGYSMRGGRMLESKYLCTFDLFSSIPTLDASKTVTKEIFDWNATIKTSSKSRLFRDGHRIDAPQFGLSEKDILDIEAPWRWSRRECWEKVEFLINLTPCSSKRTSGLCGVLRLHFNPGTVQWNSNVI